jgi:hypothetical protein
MRDMDWLKCFHGLLCFCTTNEADKATRPSKLEARTVMMARLSLMTMHESCRPQYLAPSTVVFRSSLPL